MIKVEGPVAFIGRPTVDGRVIRELDVSSRPIPVMAISDEGHQRVIGAIDDVQSQDGIVWATGQVAIEDFGRCAVGIDVDSITAVYTRNGEVLGMESISDEAVVSGEIVEEVTSGRLMAVIVYIGGEKPSWPDAHLRRVEWQ